MKRVTAAAKEQPPQQWCRQSGLVELCSCACYVRAIAKSHSYGVAFLPSFRSCLRFATRIHHVGSAEQVTLLVGSVALVQRLMYCVGGDVVTTRKAVRCKLNRRL